ncbi:MAG TPA: Nif3-like dinuclear metal center hexameric protein [Bacillota bacterium]
MSNLTHAAVFEQLEKWAPLYLAYDWDNVGLQIGSFHHPVKKIMITLDVVEDVVEEAIEREVNLIIAHHPLFFKPVHQLNLDEPKGRLVQKLMKHNITVYAAHTNLDVAVGGVNDLLCDALGILERDVFIDTYTEKLYKIAVFVPVSHMNEVLDALSDAGAGHIGNYSHCTFQTDGRGTFKPLEGTNPFIGTTNKLEKVEEVKIETIISEAKLTGAKKAIIQAHPYEEVAYDIYPLRNKGKTYGIGRIGMLPEKMTLQALGEHVKVAYGVPTIRVTGDLNRPVQKVAILGGSGEKYIESAQARGADVYITGDITYHQALDAQEMGMSIIDPGHHIEQIMKESTKKYLESALADDSVEIVTSAIQTEPFTFI